MLIAFKNFSKRSVLTKDEEGLILKASEYYINPSHPLTHADISDLVQDVMSELPLHPQAAITFKNIRTSFK